MGASTCRHCRKGKCRLSGKGSSRTPSTQPLHLIQRSQEPSKTEAEISRESEEQWIWQKDQINTLDRRTRTIIFLLRTGHCGLRKHLKRLGLADSAHCECGSEEQTPEHILQTCPHLGAVHQQFWPEDTEVGTKLWGQAAELQRTADFLAAIGLRI